VAVVGIGARLKSLLQILMASHSDLVELKAMSDDSEEAMNEARAWPYEYEIVKFFQSQILFCY
jgi:hypothetical protein